MIRSGSRPNMSDVLWRSAKADRAPTSTQWTGKLRGCCAVSTV
jgi:hypothetical protein